MPKKLSVDTYLSRAFDALVRARNRAVDNDDEDAAAEIQVSVDDVLYTMRELRKKHG